jgi:hypothetical protein
MPVGPWYKPPIGMATLVPTFYHGFPRMRKLPADEVRSTTLRMRISRPLMEKIQELAAQERRSISFMAQMLIEEAIADREKPTKRK